MEKNDFIFIMINYLNYILQLIKMNLENISDLLVPINELFEKIDYRNIECKNKINYIVNNKKLIHDFDDDIDLCILHSIQYYDNLNSFVIFGKDKNNAYHYYIDNFKKDYILFGIKYLKVKSMLIYKIMYQLLFPRMIIKTKQELYKAIETDFKYLYLYKEEYIDITVLLICKRDLKKKYPAEDVINDNFNIYIPNTKESIWNCASIFFCNNSLKFLEKQNFDYFLTKDMENSKKMFLKFRKWFLTNVEIKYQSQFLLYSSIVLYLLGHRSINDIDLYVHKIPSNLNDKISIFQQSNEIKLDFKVKNTDNWPHYWDEWLDEWAQKCGAKYFEEILGNSKYHFYFLGIKIISLDCDIKRRLIRNRPRAVADLIALRKRYSINIMIPSIPEKYIKYVPIMNKQEEEIKELLDQGYILNENNKELSIECNNDIPKFINTIIYALNDRYRMVFTIDEIKRELNMLNYETDNNKKLKKIIKKKLS